jgi:cytochrome c556
LQASIQQKRKTKGLPTLKKSEMEEIINLKRMTNSATITSINELLTSMQTKFIAFQRAIQKVSSLPFEKWFEIAPEKKRTFKKLGTVSCTVPIIFISSLNSSVKAADILDDLTFKGCFENKKNMVLNNIESQNHKETSRGAHCVKKGELPTKEIRAKLIGKKRVASDIDIANEDEEEDYDDVNATVNGSDNSSDFKLVCFESDDDTIGENKQTSSSSSSKLSGRKKHRRMIVDTPSPELQPPPFKKACSQMIEEQETLIAETTIASEEEEGQGKGEYLLPKVNFEKDRCEIKSLLVLPSSINLTDGEDDECTEGQHVQFKDENHKYIPSNIERVNKKIESKHSSSTINSVLMAGARALKEGKNRQKKNLAEAIDTFTLSLDKRVEMFVGTINNPSAPTIYSLHEGYGLYADAVESMFGCIFTESTTEAIVKSKYDAMFAKLNTSTSILALITKIKSQPFCDVEKVRKKILAFAKSSKASKNICSNTEEADDESGEAQNATMLTVYQYIKNTGQFHDSISDSMNDCIYC